MKFFKSLVATCTLAICTVGLSNAQALVGGGLVYGTDIDEVGIAIDGEFFLNNNLSLSPDIIIYFVDDGRDYNQGFWEFNTNLNFYLSKSGAAEVYGLGGLNISTSTYDPDGGERTSDSDLGVNLGIGSNFDINSRVKPFAEFKFTIGNLDQAVLMFGLHFTLD